jgi:hypothetical protein
MRRRCPSEAQRNEILKRLASWQALSPSEQLAALDVRGHRAVKQRKRLAAKLSK